jgi:arylsulfatase A-like enzyme
MKETAMTDKNLNLVVIVADTFRADHLGCYGNPWIQTPALDALAGEGVRFSSCYADGMPTIPERRVVFTGKSIIPMEVHGGWTPLRPDDVTLPAVLQNHGYTTAFMTDTYHYFKPNMNFHANFDAWTWIRGQENDNWKSGPRDKFDPQDYMPEHLWNQNGAGGRSYDAFMRQYLLNTQDIRTEADYFCARTFRRSMTWLERHDREHPFMLFIDTFDPHEPWDAPQRFREMYYDDYPCERFLFGYGVRNEDIRPEDHEAIRALYAAEVSFVDMWIGRFLDRLEELGYGDDTVIVFTSDHGTHLGEEGYFQKTPSLLNSVVAQLPLIIRHPDRAFGGTEVDALVSSVDFMPTFLDMLAIGDQPEMDGASVWDLATGEKAARHERVYSQFGSFAAVRDLNWHYFQPQNEESPGRGAHLYDLSEDPEETTNVLEEHSDVVEEMRAHLEERLGMTLPDV